MTLLIILLTAYSLVATAVCVALVIGVRHSAKEILRALNPV